MEHIIVKQGSKLKLAIENLINKLLNVIAMRKKDSLSLADENRFNGYIKELEDIQKEISPKLLGLCLNLHMINSQKQLGQGLMMAEEHELDVLVSAVKKWNEVTLEFKAHEDKVRQIDKDITVSE